MHQQHPKLSILLSTFNELKFNYLQRSLHLFSQFNSIEVIFVDGGSTDGTLQTLFDFKEQFKSKLSIHVIASKYKLRSERYNEALKIVNERTNAEESAEMILFYHPRSLLTKEGLQHLLDSYNQIMWGGFTHQFDRNHFILKFTSFYSNHVRLRFQKIIYLDHCIFVHKKILAQLTKPIWPEKDIFEDTDFCIKLKKIATPKRFNYISTTSAIRFVKNGIYKQCFMNQVLKIAYLLNMDSKLMNTWYEKKMGLNTKYDKV